MFWAQWGITVDAVPASIAGVDIFLMMPVYMFCFYQVLQDVN